VLVLSGVGTVFMHPELKGGFMVIENGVLNPELHRRLEQHFGKVNVSHRGEAMEAVEVVDAATGIPRLRILKWGETYHVKCLYCEAHALSFCHSYGQRAPASRLLTFLVTCHKNHCLDYASRKRLLHERLDPLGDLADARILPGRAASPDRVLHHLPVPFARLDELPREHPARLFLNHAGLNAAEVGRDFGVGYCGRSEDALARGRLIIPFARGGLCCGWQAVHVQRFKWRYIGAIRTPIYLNAPGMRASACVYNIDRACGYRTKVIVDTPLDVWRYGPMAVSLPGRQPSELQLQRLGSEFCSGVVILLTTGARLEQPDWKALIDMFQGKLGDKFAVIPLPKPSYPIEYERKKLRAYVANMAERRGLRVAYTRPR
jgi:hypothetical protein